jgi:5-methylcytosine-specific restriction endonuclease McrA
MAIGAAGFETLLCDEQVRFRSQHLDLPAPLIARWPAWVELTAAETASVTSRVLFARDRYTCQYCGLQVSPGSARRQLTIDHVKPAHLFSSRRAATTWDNVVASCSPCNAAKGGLLPMQAGMWPGMHNATPYVPAQPHMVQLRFAGRLIEPQREYVRDFFGLDEMEAPVVF